MPSRQVPLITGEYYHLLNRAAYQRRIFQGEKKPKVFLDIATYYTQKEPPVKYSHYKVSKNKFKPDFTDRLVTIIAYCLMPTHFHLLVKQEADKGIKIFMQKLSSAFSHYYNLKNSQRGPLFEGRFKSVRITTEEQLVHVSRYIHLNPVSSHLAESPEDYPFSSLPYFTGIKADLPFDPSVVLANFRNGKEYLSFVTARKEYQRKLEEIKHLILE